MEILGTLFFGAVAAGSANGIYGVLAAAISEHAPHLFLWIRRISILVLLLFLTEQLFLAFMWVRGSVSLDAALDGFPLLLRRAVFIGTPPAACNLAIYSLRARKEVGW